MRTFQTTREILEILKILSTFAALLRLTEHEKNVSAIQKKAQKQARLP
jgi:hypothetical protein